MDFKLKHQLLCLTGISMERKNIVGAVELTVVPTRSDLRELSFNAQQCRIHRVALNDACEAPFTYFDLMQNVCQRNKATRSLKTFTKRHRIAVGTTDSALNLGEIRITVPPEGYDLIEEGRDLRIWIEFSLENARSGIRFVDASSDDGDGRREVKSVHMYTHSYENSSRVWFPCVDSFASPCTWKLEVTVDKGLWAISCGDLEEIVDTPDLKRTTYHYSLSMPVSAPNIALAVGPFNVYVDPLRPNVGHFYLPGMLNNVKSTVRCMPAVFEFYEEVLSTPYPFTRYQQVFVQEASEAVRSYATLSIVSAKLLHPAAILEQTVASRTLMAGAVAEQFFGCLVTGYQCSDTWLIKGIARYLNALCTEKFGGNCVYRDLVQADMASVVQYEEQHGGVVLDCTQPGKPKTDTDHYFPTESSLTVSPMYLDALTKKAHLVIGMVEKEIQKASLLKVLCKLLTEAGNSSPVDTACSRQQKTLISTNSFISAVFALTGQNITPLVDAWVRTGGHAKFSVRYTYNRHQNSIDLTIYQNLVGQSGVKMYFGPLEVHIQEISGHYIHQIHIRSAKVKETLTCHSIYNSSKQAKVPLSTGENIDIDLSPLAYSEGCPILWMRVDVKMLLIRGLFIKQSAFQWHYLLRHERDITAQLTAIQALDRHPTSASFLALMHVIKCERCYLRVRCEAAHCLIQVANQMKVEWSLPPLLSVYRKFFGTNQRREASNNHTYQLQKAIPVAVAAFRSKDHCPSEVKKFIFRVIRRSENQQSYYSDVYFKAALIEAMGASIVPVEHERRMPQTRTLYAKVISKQIDTFLDLERRSPSYRLAISCSCLRVHRILQKCGHLPINSDIFHQFSAYGYCLELRIAAMECVVDFLKNDGEWADLDQLLKLLEEDPDPGARYALAELLIKKLSAAAQRNKDIDRPELLERLWNLINRNLALDAKLRSYVVDLYYSLYGSKAPKCIPLIKHDSDCDIQEGKHPRIKIKIEKIDHSYKSEVVIEPTTDNKEESQTKEDDQSKEEIIVKDPSEREILPAVAEGNSNAVGDSEELDPFQEVIKLLSLAKAHSEEEMAEFGENHSDTEGNLKVDNDGVEQTHIDTQVQSLEKASSHPDGPWKELNDSIAENLSDSEGHSDVNDDEIADTPTDTQIQLVTKMHSNERCDSEVDHYPVMENHYGVLSEADDEISSDTQMDPWKEVPSNDSVHSDRLNEKIAQNISDSDDAVMEIIDAEAYPIIEILSDTDVQLEEVVPAIIEILSDTEDEDRCMRELRSEERHHLENTNQAKKRHKKKSKKRHRRKKIGKQLEGIEH